VKLLGQGAAFRIRAESCYILKKRFKMQMWIYCQL